MTCLFCDIISKKIPADILLETKELMAFRDIQPRAPHHILIIPKKHIETIDDVSEEDEALMGKLIITAKQLGRTLGLSESGYRLLFNVKSDGGQEIYHIHLHLLGGRPLQWPPG